MTDAVILCGGLGTRLRSVLSDRPKGMADIGGRPFLHILLDYAAKQGFKRFILCTGYRAEDIEASFPKAPGREILFSRETEPLGTGGALKLCRPLCGSDPILVMNGDTFCPLDLAAFLDFHAKKGAAASLAAVPVGDRKDGGTLSIGKDGKVTSFAEKGAAGGFINAGICAFGKEVFERIPAGRPCSMEREIFPRLAAEGKLCAWASDKPLYDIGTPERLEAFRRAFSDARGFS